MSSHADHDNNGKQLITLNRFRDRYAKLFLRPSMRFPRELIRSPTAEYGVVFNVIAIQEYTFVLGLFVWSAVTNRNPNTSSLIATSSSNIHPNDFLSLILSDDNNSVGESALNNAHLSDRSSAMVDAGVVVIDRANILAPSSFASRVAVNGNPSPHHDDMVPYGTTKTRLFSKFNSGIFAPIDVRTQYCVLKTTHSTACSLLLIRSSSTSLARLIFNSHRTAAACERESVVVHYCRSRVANFISCSSSCTTSSLYSVALVSNASCSKAKSRSTRLRTLVH